MVMANVRMRSMLLLVKLLNICSGNESGSGPGPGSGLVLQEPTNFTSENGELNVTLVFGNITLPEESTGLSGSLQMLGFNGVSPGPTLRVRAGDTLRIRLNNTMPPELVSTANVTNNYHGFDTVNLHTHGLHISPLAPGDDIVDTRVGPGDTYEYTYHIPDDHMGGTFWYHPHYHGAAAIQVNFGAAGMIIVEDAENQLPAEVATLEDIIVVAYHVDYDDIAKIVKSYIKNCKKLHDGTQSCHDVEKCSEVVDGLACQKCADRLCEAQAEPFKDTKPKESKLLLVNGQHKPTLTITADTWVRLRLGLIASKDYL